MIQRSRPSVRVLAAAGVAVGLLFVSSVASGQADDPLEPVLGLGGPPGYQGVEAGGEYPIDLETRSFKAKLPFDVTFVVKGPIGEEFEELTAQFVEFNRPPNCPTYFRPATIRVARGDRPRDAKVRTREQPQPVEYSPALEAVITGSGDSRQFRVEMPELRPNRYYCFKFVSKKKVDEETLLKLRGDFFAAIDGELRKPEYRQEDELGDSVAVVSTRQYDALRRRLIVLVEGELAPGQEVLASANSYFDADAAFGDITARYRIEFDQLLNSQDRTYARVDNSEQKARRAAQILSRMAAATFGDRTLAEIVSAQDSLRVQNGVDLVEVLGATGPELLGITHGLAAGEIYDADDADADNRWEVGEVEARIERLKNLSLALASLTTIGEQAGLGRDEQAALEELVDAVLGELGEPDDGDWDGEIEDLGKLAAALEVRGERLQQLIGDLFVELREVVRIGGSTVADYETRAMWYMSADIGGGVAPDTEDLFTYIGWNIYLRPVNKKAHLSWKGRPFSRWDEFKKRFSFTLGLVQQGFEEENGQFQGVVGSKAAVIGAGMRVNDAIRLSIGGLVFENEDPDPLISGTKLNWTPYLAISLDWNATKTFANIFSGLFPGAGSQ
jgi:hypothetical protein